MTSTFEQGPEQYGVTMSLGLAVMEPGGEVLSPDELIGQADQALLTAKKNGKNGIEAHSPKAKWFSFKN